MSAHSKSGSKKTGAERRKRGSQSRGYTGTTGGPQLQLAARQRGPTIGRQAERLCYKRRRRQSGNGHRVTRTVADGGGGAFGDRRSAVGR